MSSVEDKMHVLIHCRQSAPLRKDLYDCIYHLWLNFKDLHDDHKFNYLLNSDGPIVKVLARFFYLASLEYPSVKDRVFMYFCNVCLFVSVCLSVCLPVSCY